MPDGRMAGRSDCDRRQFLGLLAGGLFLSVGQSVQRPVDSLPGTGPSGRLYAPEWAGRPVQPVTAQDNLAVIQSIEKRLRCTCGCGLDIYTCRTTDFTCTYSPALHKDVLAEFNAGKTPQQIVDDFVARYGQQALMAPPKRGFNLAGYFVPGIAVLAAGVILALVLRRWVREGAAEPAAAALPLAAVNATPAELEQLRRDLDDLET
jgi:cytochrome c-type biogenesis protein CcmH/NrfF